MKNQQIVIISGIAALLILFTIVAGCLFYYNTQSGSAPAAVGNTNQTVQTSPTAATTSDNPFLPPAGGQVQSSPVENRSWFESTLEITGRLFLAVILASILAFRPRKNVPLFRRNLYVAQTQILLAVVAAALMLIVGDNTARAFAIFAAVSLVRFRTNIRDPKEITVLLISLALGLASGVGRWDLGLALCLFALVLLWLLEFREPEKVFRSLELTVTTRDTDTAQGFLRKLLEEHKLEAEVRQITPTVAEQAGCLVYYLNLPLNLSTDTLSEEILRFSAGSIEGIEWKLKKNANYIYQ